MEMQLVTQVHGGTYQILSNARPAKYYIVNSRIRSVFKISFYIFYKI